MTGRLCAVALFALGAFVVPERSYASSQTLDVSPTIGGPFELTTHKGEPFSESDLAGAPYVVFFGFTYCPIVCPTTLWELSQDLAALGSEADGLNVVFATVDPERDTQETLATYLSSFDPRIVGLYGTVEQTAQFARNYKAVYRKVPVGDEDYTVEHTAIMYLVDADGRLFDTIRYHEDGQDVRLDKLRGLAAKSAQSSADR